MISCRKASELSSLAQDKRLTFAQKMQMKTHLLMCSACRNFSKNMTSLSVAMEVFRDVEVRDGKIETYKEPAEHGKPDSKS